MMLGYYYNHSRHDQIIGNAWEKNAHSISKAVLLPARWALNDALDFYMTPKEKVRIVKFGPNFDDYGYKYTKANKKQYNLLLVGVDYYRKGMDVAIETVKLLNENLTIKFALSIVGVEKPSTVEIPDYVTFYGKLRKSNELELKKMVECYLEHDIFILPTKAECVGMVFAEAAMFGLPVFTYATGGTPDYVEDGISGRCLSVEASAEDYCKAIIDSIESGTLEKFSVNARTKYEKELNWKSWLEQIERIVNDDIILEE
jgi:glycosyltransferase involved in cell wall biosynthesis